MAIALSLAIPMLLKANGIESFWGWVIGFFSLLIWLYSFVLAGWGNVTLKMHFKEVAKSAWQVAKYGYKIGETVKTTKVDVSHEFGNTYKVTSRTEDKGLLFACIGMGCIMLAWMGYCVYKGSFLTFKKIKDTKLKLEEYEKQKR